MKVWNLTTETFVHFIIDDNFWLKFCHVHKLWQRRVEKYWDLLSPKITSNTLRNIMNMKENMGSFADVRDRGSNMKTKAWSLEKSLKMFCILHVQVPWVASVLVVILNVASYSVLYLLCIIMSKWEENFLS